MLQYGRPTKTNNTHVLISKRTGRFDWDLAVIKQFFYFDFHESQYAFAVVQVFSKVAPYEHDATGFKIVKPQPLHALLVVPIVNIKQKVVLLQFIESFEMFNNEHVMLILSNYK